jgi:hypothetical protein
MWKGIKSFWIDANMRMRDLFYIAIIGFLMMVITDRFAAWFCNCN